MAVQSFCVGIRIGHDAPPAGVLRQVAPARYSGSGLRIYIEGAGGERTAKLLSRDEVWRIAANIAKLAKL